MRLTIMKIVIISIAFIVAMAINDAIFKTGGKLNAIVIIGLLAFTGAVWKWKPKGDKEKSDSHDLDKT